ncbi:MAG: prepilin-type N-terminal cleavage/methylation domain-containing protein [Firmicutes bacterium]|nr:prepilin-type N-terminal cleavage/methylation domain-containing protein [Bacillota bacterium]
MKKFRSESGFTLVELLVSMLCTALIMAGVLTWLLVGIRIESSATDTMERQNKARVVMTLMESMVNSGNVAQVQKVKTDVAVEEGVPTDVGTGCDWALLNEDGKVLVRYRAGSGSIVSGNGDVLMADLDHSDATYDSEKQIMRLSMTADGEIYSKDIYFRVKPKDDKEYDRNEMLEEQRENRTVDSYRLALLTMVSNQIGSDGKIIDQTGFTYAYDYFTECYLYNTGNLDAWSADYSKEWNPATPWCATFVSWALTHMNHDCAPLKHHVSMAYVPIFANVDDGRALFHENYNLGTGFTTGGYGATNIGAGNGQQVWGKDHPNQKVGKWVPATNGSTGEAVIPTSGDLIFFDWDGDANSPETGEDGAHLEHVGIVFYVTPDQSQVFTIEGNTDGKVAMRSYSISDPTIVGYGVLDWAGTHEPEKQPPADI